MTASPEALAPTHRPSPRAVVLAILGMALLGLLAVGTMQYAMPQGDEARGIAPLPKAVGATSIILGGREIWLTRSANGELHAIDNRYAYRSGLAYLPPDSVNAPIRACFPDGAFTPAAPYGYPFFALDGTRWSALSPMQWRYPVRIESDRVHVNLSDGMAVDSRPLQLVPDPDSPERFWVRYECLTSNPSS